jgi:adenosylmethionine-8-amino-7-oxononanoate aminotransferase
MVNPNPDNNAWWIKDSYSREEIDQLVKWGLEHFWMQSHQMADLVAPGGYNIMVKGDDCYIYDIEGKKYIDAMGGLLLKNIGHNRPEVADAVAEQMKTLAYSNSGSYSTIPGILLSKKIAELAPGDLNRTFFVGGGSEAVETALKMARQYQFISGKPMKSKFIWRRGQYHGSSSGAMGVSTSGNRGGGMFATMAHTAGVSVDAPYCYQCPWGYTDRSNKNCCMQSPTALQNVIKAEGAGTIAAFIATPITNASQIPPDEYFPAIRQICDDNDILFIADEIICGFGRLGTWFGMQRFGVDPDMMTMAKGLSSGELPIGAVAASKKVAEAFDSTEGENGAFHHGVTFGGHAAVMAAALKNIEILERENLVENSATVGRYLYDRSMAVLQENHPSVGYVGGGLGLWLNLEMVKNRETKERYPGGPQGAYARRFTEKLREYGLATRAGDSINLSPPLTMTKEIVDDMIEILDRSMSEMETEFPPDNV